MGIRFSPENPPRLSLKLIIACIIRKIAPAGVTSTVVGVAGQIGATARTSYALFWVGLYRPSDSLVYRSGR